MKNVTLFFVKASFPRESQPVLVVSYFRMDACIENNLVTSETEEIVYPMPFENQNAIYKEELEQLCRLCGNSSNQLMSIFTGDGAELDLPKKIREHLPIIEIAQNDSFPSNVCYQCASTLISWHELYHICKNADERLKEISKKLSTNCENHVEMTDFVNESKDAENSEQKQKLDDDLRDLKMDTHYSLNISDEILKPLTFNSHSSEIQLQYCDDDPNTQSEELLSEEKRCVVNADRVHNQEPPTTVSKIDPSETKCSICEINIYENGKYLNGDLVCARCHEEEYEIDYDYEKGIHDLNKTEEENSIIPPQHFKIRKEFQRFLILQSDDSFFFKCDQCEFTCKESTKQFEEHYTSHFVVESDEKGDHFLVDVYKQPQMNDGENLQCDVCKKVFLKRTDLIGHLKNFHQHKKVFKCGICGGTFKSKLQLKTHKKRHVRKPVNNTLIFCEICKKYFKTKKGFAYHQQNICVQYKCYICDETFLVHSLLQEHMKKKHEVEKKGWDDTVAATDVKTNDNETVMNVCPICGKIVTRAVLPRHMVLHNEDRPFTCDLCGKQFKRKHSLQDHIMIEMGMKNYVCDICGMKFLKQGYLNKHLRYHKLNNGEFQGFPCEVCGKKFPEKWRLGVHQRAVHKGGKFSSCKCDICERLFAERWMVKLHKAKEHNGEEFKEYECDICGKKFLEKWLIKSHQRTTHRSGVKKLYCDLCGRSDHVPKDCSHRHILQNVKCVLCGENFSSHYYLKNHVMTVHSFIEKKMNECGGDGTDEGNGDSSNIEGTKIDPFQLRKNVLYICAGCGRHFLNKQNLRLHETKDNCYKHVKYDCTECGKSYASKSSLSNHMMMHTKATAGLPYHCNFCNKDFVSSEGLKSHLSLDKICLLCDKVYPCNDRLKSHVFSEHKDNDNEDSTSAASVGFSFTCGHYRNKGQNGVNGSCSCFVGKPFECKLCGKKFTRKQAMKNHLFAEMNLRRYVCEFCDKSYNYYSHLKEHIVTNHGEKEYLCGYCGKDFPTKKRFRDHVTLHSEEKPFMCQCGQSFKLSRYLSKHKKHCRASQDESVGKNC